MTKLFKSVQRNLQINILAAFSALLFLSFAIVGIAFNLAINQYIRSSALSMLNEARGMHYNILELSPQPFLWVMGGRQGNFLRTHLNSFVIDADYRLLNPYASYSAYYIADMLETLDIPAADAHNMRLRSRDRTYFITSVTAPGGFGRSIIFYVDVTDLQLFTRGINMLLLSLAGFIWVAAMIITGFLANSLAKPLFALRNFARRIGQGDFTLNPDAFINEEFEALNESLNQTAKQLAKYDTDQKTFFQNVSHELRTPLMTIKSYAEGIKYGLMEPEKATHTILEATERLTDMVDDILYISRIDSISMPAMERCDLRTLIRERIRLGRPLAELRGLSINFEPQNDPVTVNCAVLYIGRALDNLINNALRFAESTINVECRLADNFAQIIVTDDGPGFEAELLPHIFERFFKGKNGQTGIGLAVVRSIAEQHKGYAKAENCETGAKLTIGLPRNK